MLSRDQKCVTKHILEMNTTLFRFRDPAWCIQSQLNERMWSCEPHWRSIQWLINFGTPFFVFLEISKFNIKFVITWFKLYHMLKLTLTLLACYDWGYNRSPSGDTRDLDIGRYYIMNVNMITMFPFSIILGFSHWGQRTTVVQWKSNYSKIS